jgi:predicted nucleic-acid-binding protein
VGRARQALPLIAVDTNVLIRLITADEPLQTRRVEELIQGSYLFVSMLALLETEWVLRSSHGYSRQESHSALLALVQLENIIVEAMEFVTWALDRHSQGADLADMLLLVAARDAEAFATFDKKLEKQAGAASPVPVMKLKA